MSDTPTQRTLAEVLDTAPDPAVFSGAAATTRTELDAAIDDAAARLLDAGVAPGRVVAVQLPNGADLVAHLFAVWRIGAVYAPFNPRAAADEVAANLELVAPAALVTADGVQARAGASDHGTDTALVQFTSGTTGRPKAVPLRHATVLDLLDRVIGSIRRPASVDASGTTDPGPAPATRPPMPNLVPVSLSLWAGIYQVLFAFRVGAPVVLMERFGTVEFRDLVQRHEVRSTVLPPAAMTMLADDDRIADGGLAPLRIVRSITAPLAPAQARRFHERFGVIVLNSYGQTELGGEVVGWTTADTRAFGEAKLGSAGRPHAGVDVRADTATGELLVRTPSTRPDTVAPDLRERLVDGEWLRTGDLGRVDDDGFVWIDGRVSDMINRGGNKVFPAHVEEVLLSSPLVGDAAVVGVPDDRLGEVPWAFVVPARGTPAPVDDAALATWCRERLTPYRVPARFVTVDALPRNPVGKVLRRELRDRAVALLG